MVKVHTTFITPKPPPAVPGSEAAFSAALFVQKAKRKIKEQGRSTGAAPVVEERRLLPVIVGTGELPAYYDAPEVEPFDDLKRELTAYDELQRVVMRVNRVFDNYAQGTKEGDANAPPLTVAEVDMLHMGITDMLSLQERVAVERKRVLRDALAQVRDGADETPSGADDDMGGGAEALVDRAIAAKQTQVQRLAELHEGEISLLQQLQETVQELSSTLRVARGEAKGARREVAELRAQLHDQINRVSTAERAVEEARDALRSAELEHEEELETKLRALQTVHVRALHELDQRADAAEAEVATLQVSLTRAQAQLLQIDKLREENNRLQVECDGWAAKLRRAAEESASQASIAAARQLDDQTKLREAEEKSKWLQTSLDDAIALSRRNSEAALREAQLAAEAEKQALRQELKDRLELKLSAQRVEFEARLQKALEQLDTARDAHAASEEKLTTARREAEHAAFLSEQRTASAVGEARALCRRDERRLLGRLEMAQLSAEAVLSAMEAQAAEQMAAAAMRLKAVPAPLPAAPPASSMEEEAEAAAAAAAAASAAAASAEVSRLSSSLLASQQHASRRSAEVEAQAKKRGAAVEEHKQLVVQLEQLERDLSAAAAAAAQGEGGMSTQARASLEKTRDKLVSMVEASSRALERSEGDAQKLNAERLAALREHRVVLEHAAAAQLAAICAAHEEAMAALAAQGARGMRLAEERLQGATEVGDALRAQLEEERAKLAAAGTELRASLDEVQRLAGVVDSLRTELKAAQEALSTALASSAEPSPPDSIQIAKERLQLAARAFLAHSRSGSAASEAAVMAKAEAAARAVLEAFEDGTESVEASSRASFELARRLLGIEISLLEREGAVASAALEAAAEQLRAAYAGQGDAAAQAVAVARSRELEARSRELEAQLASADQLVLELIRAELQSADGELASLHALRERVTSRDSGNGPSRPTTPGLAMAARPMTPASAELPLELPLAPRPAELEAFERAEAAWAELARLKAQLATQLEISGNLQAEKQELVRLLRKIKVAAELARSLLIAALDKEKEALVTKMRAELRDKEDEIARLLDAKGIPLPAAPSRAPPPAPSAPSAGAEPRETSMLELEHLRARAALLEQQNTGQAARIVELEAAIRTMTSALEEGSNMTKLVHAQIEQVLTEARISEEARMAALQNTYLGEKAEAEAKMEEYRAQTQQRIERIERELGKPRGGSRTGSRETARDAVAEQYAYSFGALSTLPHGQASVKASVKASGQACAIATPSRVPGAVLGAVLGAVPVLGGSSSAGNIRRPLTQGGAHVSRAADAKKTPFYALSADQQRQQLRKEWLAHGDASPSTEPLPKVSASVRPLYVPSAVPSSSWAARQEAHSSAPSAAAPLTVRRALPVGLAKSLPRPGTALEALEAFRELQGGDAAPRARLPKRSGSPLGVELYVATNLHGRQLVAL
ncbi:hypothetical protein Ctob_007998 [Chrysochromulina tobinii]|uniref:Uncharacterized protein n=1 Tax=Chrysochromulina tobinii TaxID=1460289 RepID=A0A0M0JYY2_9EUKA|nr:hypothetical protein Ctob_007998 [Chrysochromulina tobinii]|eukprot:KOO31861.1 hypothetical protein Ctob_007998 [Chrysochromulina sp. CCMP291]